MKTSKVKPIAATNHGSQWNLLCRMNNTTIRQRIPIATHQVYGSLIFSSASKCGICAFTASSFLNKIFRKKRIATQATNTSPPM